MRALVLGVCMVVIGVLLVFAGGALEGDFSVGGVIFIGPIPIVFGSGPSGGELALASVLIGGIMFVSIVFWAWTAAKSRG